MRSPLGFTALCSLALFAASVVLVPTTARADDVVDLSDDTPKKPAEKGDKKDGDAKDDKGASDDKAADAKKPASASSGGTAGSPELYHDYGPIDPKDLPPDTSAGPHGSQVAASELLPIFLGGAGGIVLGALVGAPFDSDQPPTKGALIGAAIGGFTGASGGAWLIRGLRDKDTRWAGALTGLGVGTGVGVVLFAKLDTRGNDATPIVGKVLALTLVPAIGALAGRQLAIYVAGDGPKEKSAPPPVVSVIRPSVVATPTGVTFGVDGAWF